MATKISFDIRWLTRWAAPVALLACHPACGAWFSKGQPVPQWGLDAAKTHTPDYVKDAPAVILYDEYLETIDAQGRALERERKAIRILKPQGRTLGSCQVSYNENQKINYFRAWTVAADEKQYQAQDTDFAEAGDTNVPVMLSTRKTRIAHPPAIDVAAIVVCESEELMEPYSQEEDWLFQDRIPIVFEALEIDLPPVRRLTHSWHRHDPIQPIELSPGHFRWELRDIPAFTLRDVPSSPEWFALAQRMSVQWGEAAVDGTANQWRAIGQWVTRLEANRPDPSPEITAKVQSLIEGAPDFYTRLSRITESIQKDIRYFVVMRGIGGLQANHAADIYRNRYGDCKDKTTLLISMLQVAGIHAYYMPVDDKRGVVDPDDPSLIGNHMITAIELPDDVQDPRLKAIARGNDGRRYLIFDPTNEHTPIGNLPSYLQGGFGTLAAGPASQIIALPVLDPDANGTEQKGSFTLSPDGTLSGTVDTSHFGPDGAEFRLFLKRVDQKERREIWEKYVASSVPGVTLVDFDFIQPSALDKPLEFHYKVSVPQYAHQAGPLLLVRPRVVGSYSAAFDDKPRTVPIELAATGRWRDSFDITLPSGYTLDDTPDPVNVDLDFAAYHSTVTAKANSLHYEREFIVRQVQIPAEKAADFRKLESAILTDEKSTAVLKKQ